MQGRLLGLDHAITETTAAVSHEANQHILPKCTCKYFLIAEFISPQKVYTFSFIVYYSGSILPKITLNPKTLKPLKV